MYFPTVVRSQILPVPVEIWHNHTYSNSFLTSMKNVLQGTVENSCFPILTERPLMFFVDKTVYAGDVMVSFRGDRLDCVPQTYPGAPMLVLQTESSCNVDDRSPLCGHPQRCIPNTYETTPAPSPASVSQCLWPASATSELQSISDSMNKQLTAHHRRYAALMCMAVPQQYLHPEDYSHLTDQMCDITLPSYRSTSDY